MERFGAFLGRLRPLFLQPLIQHLPYLMMGNLFIVVARHILFVTKKPQLANKIRCQLARIYFIGLDNGRPAKSGRFSEAYDN